jgi:hypothetical protein
MCAGHNLPDTTICHTQKLYDTNYYVCMVENPSRCLNATLVRKTYLCDHSHNHDFAEHNR